MPPTDRRRPFHPLRRRGVPLRPLAPPAFTIPPDASTYEEHLQRIPGLVSVWRLNEQVGNVAWDGFGKNHGLYVGPPTLGDPGPLSSAPSETDLAALFDGVTDYVSIPHSSDLDLGAGDMTIGVWLRKSVGGATATMELYQKGSFSPHLQLFDGGSGHYIEFYPLDSTASVHSAGLYTDALWHYATGTKSAGNVWLLYKDGVEGTVVESAGTAAASSTTASEIGRRYNNTRYFAGDIAFVEIYNVVLTPAQIMANNLVARGIFPWLNGEGTDEQVAE